MRKWPSEALHFIEYLSSKTADRAEMTDLILAQEHVMIRVLDNPDDEVWNDIKTLRHRPDPT